VVDTLEGYSPVNFGTPDNHPVDVTVTESDGLPLDNILNVGETWTYTYSHTIQNQDLNTTSALGWSDRGQTDHTVVSPTSANGALFFAGSDVNATGTGLIQSFLRIQDSPTESGFNTDYRPVELADKSGPFTHSIKLGDIPVITIDGVQYREFRLDLNEKDSQSNDLITLTDLKILSANTGDLHGWTGGGFSSGSSTLLYDMDGAGDVSVGLNAWSTGSGHGDYVVTIREDAFRGVDDGAYIYLYSAFANNDGGFEEWYLQAPSQLTNTVNITTDQGASGSSSVGVTFDSSADLSITKIAKVTGQDGDNIANNAGDLITYTITLHNTSNVDLHNVVVSDPFAGGATFVSGDTGNDHVMGVNETWVYTASHVVTQSEIDAGGQIVNTATVSSDQTLPQSAVSLVGVENGFHQGGSSFVFQDPHAASYWASHSSAFANGVLVGDTNGNGVADAGEDTLFFSAAAVHDLISIADSSNDVRLGMAREALAAQLNINDLAAQDGHSGKAYAPAGLVTDAVEWLKGEAPFQFSDGSSGNVDSNHDGIVGWNANSHNFTEGSAAKSNKAAWGTQVDVYNGPIANGDWDNNSSLAGNQEANGLNLMHALQNYNAEQLVVSTDGQNVGWNNGVSVVGVHSNDTDNFWLTLKDTGHIG
jgi:uncharacterized repeat protein (TIGR01451 family)